MKTFSLTLSVGLMAVVAAVVVPVESKSAEVLTGREAMGDWTTDAPGVRRKITVADLPKPHEVKSVKNRPKIVARPEGAWPKVPEGFKVELYAEKLKHPRVLVTAPNGDVLVAESKADRVSILRDTDGDGKPESNTVFADGLKQPFGMAFYPVDGEPQFVYIANTDSVVRFPYKNGQVKVEGEPELITELSRGGQLTGGGHWTRDIAFSADGKKLFVSIGSKSNVNDDAEEADRARIFECDPDGKNKRVYAWGVRNPVGLAVQPESGELWTSVNERDELGDNLPPDYVTKVKDGGFYGWPWFYTGGHEDPSHVGKKPELKDQVLVPDVLLQSHTASLDLAFYTGAKFPAEYKNHLFVAQHGSWNRERRTGYKLIRVSVVDGKATGEYEDFMTGFVTAEGDVWGRPVGVTVSKDGALLVSDDEANCIWRISYEGGK